jgi:hypothetical protein
MTATATDFEKFFGLQIFATITAQKWQNPPLALLYVEELAGIEPRV